MISLILFYLPASFLLLDEEGNVSSKGRALKQKQGLFSSQPGSRDRGPPWWRGAHSSLSRAFSFQAAQIVLISLFELNTPEFTMLLGALPKTFQDGATKLLHNHLKNSSNTVVVSALLMVWS